VGFDGIRRGAGEVMGVVPVANRVDL